MPAIYGRLDNDGCGVKSGSMKLSLLFLRGFKQHNVKRFYSGARRPWSIFTVMQSPLSVSLLSS